MDIHALQLMGIAGMEDASDLASTAADIGEDLPKTAEEVETQGAEVVVAETGAEVQELAQVVEKVAEVVEEQQEDLEELQDAVDGLEGLFGSANYSAPAAALLYARAQKLHTRLGGRDTGDRLGAESLGDATTAQMAMRAGMEGFTDTVKKYANAAITFIKNMWDSLIAFLVGLFNRAAGIRRLAESLKKRVEASGFTVKEKIKLGKWNNLVDYTGKNVKFNDIGAQIFAGTKALAETVKKTESFMVAAGQDQDKSNEWGSTYTAVTNALKAIIDKVGNKKETKAAGKDAATGHFGGLTVMLTFRSEAVKNLDDISKAAKATRISFSVRGEGNKTPVSGEQKAKWDVSQLKSRCDDVISGTKEIEVAKNEQAFSGAARDRAIANLKVLANKESKEAPKAIAAIKSVYAMANTIVSNVSRLALDGYAAELSAVKAHM